MGGLFGQFGNKGKGEEQEPLISNLTTFQLALREGMGFAYACAVSENDPKHVTKLMLEDEQFMKDCKAFIRGANTDRLMAASAHAKKEDWDKADKARRDANKVSRLYLWGSKGELEDMSEDDVFDVYVELDGDHEQIAVAVGATPKALKEYLESKPELMNMIKLMRKQWNEGIDSQGKKR